VKVRVFATAITSVILLSLGTPSSIAVADPIPTDKSIVILDPFQDEIRATKISKVVNQLKSRVNRTPYVRTGSSIYGWDCSGLVRWMYEQLGVGVPHSADKQAHIGKRVHRAQVGDIVVFARRGSTDFYHSGIYVGGGKVLNANRYYKTTVVEPLSDYGTDQVRFVRVDLNCWKNYKTEYQSITNCEGINK
jgi:cell wall-associated NlpC family hydrolase